MNKQLPLPNLPVEPPVEPDMLPAVYPAADLTYRSSLQTAIKAFEVHMERQGFAENTIKAFRSDLNILGQFIGIGTAIGDISTRDLNRFAHWLVHQRGVPCNPKSLSRRITTLKVFFGWLAESDVLSYDPADAVIHRPVMTPLPKILSDAEVERVLAVTSARRHADPPDARPHLLVTLLLHTGIKKGECMAIVLNHFDFSAPDRPLLWIRYANPRRRHKERKLLCPLWWPALLAEYCAQYSIQEALFPCTARNLEYVLADVARLAELPHSISFEMLRWTCAVRDYRAGMPADQLRQKLGVSKITWRELSVKISRLAEQANH